MMAGILLEGGSDQERAAYARKLAAENNRTAVDKMERAKALNGAVKTSMAMAIPGIIRKDTIVPAGANHYVSELSSGTHLRIIDLGGQQAVDFLAFDLSDTQIRYNNANSIKLNRTIYVTTGFRLYSDLADVLMTVVADTVGRHDTIGGACSSHVNRLRYGIENACGCRDNFLTALATRGMSARDIHANVNFFMNVPVHHDGSAEIEEGISRPGDFVDLRADKDVLVVMSNCPQFYNPCSGWNPTPIRVIEWSEQAAT
jgi:urea carboxylase-associated protein 1